MNEHTISAIVSTVLAVIGLAIIAVLVSNAAQTGNVFTTTGRSIANVISCALSPVTGAACGTSVVSTVSFG